MTALSLTLATLSGAFISGFVTYFVMETKVRDQENMKHTYKNIANDYKAQLDSIHMKAKKRK